LYEKEKDIFGMMIMMERKEERDWSCVQKEKNRKSDTPGEKSR